MPVLYRFIEKKKKSIFTLISDSFVWATRIYDIYWNIGIMNMADKHLKGDGTKGKSKILQMRFRGTNM